MTNVEVIGCFENGNPPGEEFHHAEHIRVGFAYICEFPIVEALEKFSSALKRLAVKSGRSHLYNETITWAYLFLIRERITLGGGNVSWAEFVEQNPDLLAWKPGILSRYYREETLQSDLAKTMFVLPDKHQ
ncbi:MAG TPA: hypothetical protein VN684_12885 [Terriglobales bacterium]|nr:hypothetical protein [Terriglobales bacterium]